MILLAYLLQRNATWRLTTLRIFTFVQSGQDVFKTQLELGAYLQALRIKAEVHVLSLEVADMGAYGEDWTVRRARRGEQNKGDRKLGDLFADPALDKTNGNNGSTRLPSPVAQPMPASTAFDEGSKIRQAIVENSRESALVLLNLPPPPKSSWLEPESYFRLVEHLTEGLQRVVLVYGSGSECLSTHI